LNGAVAVLIVRTVVVTPFVQNARVLIDDASRRSVAVDPGGEAEKILPLLKLRDEPTDVESIFLTHAHIDHAGGVEPLRRMIAAESGRKPPLLAHRLEKELRAAVKDTAVLFGLSPQDYENAPEPDRYVDEGDELSIGEHVGKLLFTPGHSPGHLAVYFPSVEALLETEHQRAERYKGPLVIGGDVLFAGTIGRTDLPGGDHETLLRSVREKLFVLPDETRVLCGHGGDTTIGTEKKINPFFQ